MTCRFGGYRRRHIVSWTIVYKSANGRKRDQSSEHLPATNRRSSYMEKNGRRDGGFIRWWFPVISIAIHFRRRIISTVVENGLHNENSMKTRSLYRRIHYEIDFFSNKFYDIQNKNWIKVDKKDYINTTNKYYDFLFVWLNICNYQYTKRVRKLIDFINKLLLFDHKGELIVHYIQFHIK